MRSAGRVDGAKAFILHTRPYSESSLIVDAFTREHGRVPLVARGARRPRSALRGVLLGFQPVMLGWSGRGEVRTLMRAEWLGGLAQLAGDQLLCGFYLNELVMRMLAREDPHDQVFDDYAHAVQRLSVGDDPEPVLRIFEKRLLAESGYALMLEQEADTGKPIDPYGHYTYDPERGPISVTAGRDDQHVLVLGRSLLALHAEHFEDAVSLVDAKLLMRMLITHRLDHRPLLSRQVLRELQRL